MKTAFPSTRNPVTITLYENIPFDNTYKHHSLISSVFYYNNSPIYNATVRANERFIDRKDITQTGNPYYYRRWTLTDTFNFNYTNGLISSVVLELTAEQTNANYLKVVCGSDIYYYFITGISQLNLDTYTLNLELDVLMTYQDEFLIGMKDMPVFATRKHCHRYTNNGLMPYCADFKTGDDAFAGVKPNKISLSKKLNFYYDEMKKLKGVMWLYVCVDTTASGITDADEHILYSFKGHTFPLTMFAIPINVNSVTYTDIAHSVSYSFPRARIIEGLMKLIGNGSIHGAKVSPYPPFSIGMNDGNITFANGDLTINGDSTELYNTAGNVLYSFDVGGSTLLFGYLPTFTPTLLLFEMMNCGYCLISNQTKGDYDLENTYSNELGFKNTIEPSILLDSYEDPKLLFSPFKKYVINAQYATEPYIFYPELLYSDTDTTSDDIYFSLTSYTTSYIGDNNIFTTLSSSATNTWNNYAEEKLGLASNINYIIPCGTNALDVFNTTQAQSFYQSKVASGITSGLTVAGGIASIAVGATLGVTSKGILTPVGAGMISSGVTAIAGGTASAVNTIKSTNAKIEDLKNTPDSVNISGSNFLFDECLLSNTECLPYIDVYDVSNVIKENANGYFYRYGYQVSRNCYFNNELKYDNSGNNKVDNNLFGRTIFNYIQINEDITNKINAQIPLIVKQKLSSIFNNGITLWTFFGFASLWGSQTENSTYKIDKWFMKEQLDNTEYKGNSFN